VLRSADGSQAEEVRTESTYALVPEDLTRRVEPRLAQYADRTAELPLASKLVRFTLANLAPTHVLDPAATAEAENRAEAEVPRSAGEIVYAKNQPLVKAGEEIKDQHWQLLRAENEAFHLSLDAGAWKGRAGVAATSVIMTIVLGCYVAMFQPKVVRNHARAVAIAALLLSMLLVAQLAGLASSPVFVFAVAPTVIVAMILAIAYDQRFAAGVATVQAVLVTIAVGEGLSFFLIVLCGVLTCCLLLDDVRTRSKLIEVGGAAALAMMAAVGAAGLLNLDPLVYVGRSALYTGAAGLAAGFLVLGILPVIEKWFRITTSVRLLELADASHPLLRRLAIEAPGTYNHSLQVATIAEAAAESIGANSLLCRVASYYHDVGKINKADYFVENQFGGVNRHINLSPSVSLLIIIGHVKDGIELAKEYDLPTSIYPFIQQHHGTTLVEYFYHRACNQQQQQQQLCAPGTPDAPAISETQYRYPGPKPRTREAAVVMIADACESATRTLTEPNAPRIEQLVHELVMKRLLDGQFEECDVTMREIEQVERACVRILLGIYHGRIAYPSTAAIAAAPSAPTGPVAARTA
jgi:putative nucleotidyltransferase with HDIG domain